MSSARFWSIRLADVSSRIVFCDCAPVPETPLTASRTVLAPVAALPVAGSKQLRSRLPSENCSVLPGLIVTLDSPAR